jgi:homoserine/homoserine lactone efflux protein
MWLETRLACLVAPMGLPLSPGTSGPLALTHDALHGRGRTPFTNFGAALGFVALIALSMSGTGALLEASVARLTVPRWLGGACLVWLGIEVWRTRPLDVRPTAAPAQARGWSLFRQGAQCAATDPEGPLLSTARLPHFIEPGRNLPLQFGVLAGAVDTKFDGRAVTWPGRA